MKDKKIESLTLAGAKASEIHRKIAQMIRPGLNLTEIEDFALAEIEAAGMKPAFLGYKGYKFATCLSVNEEVVHGLPHDYSLQSGDIIAVDLGVSLNGWIVDTARTHPVGKITPKLANLLSATRHALEKAIEQCFPGNTVGDIGAAVENVVTEAGFAVIRELTGHGTGQSLQEPPSIPNHGKKGTGIKLKPGMVIAIEPITAVEKSQIGVLSDGWTIITTNGSPTAHFEDTVLITDSNPVVLTK